MSSFVDGYKKLFDGNLNVAFYLNLNDSIKVTFEDDKVISGFRYIPNQSRDASRHIVDYELYIDGKKVQCGTFGNIKNNPIEQVVRFDGVKGKTVTFVPTRNTDGSKNCGIAEFSIITN